MLAHISLIFVSFFGLEKIECWDWIAVTICAKSFFLQCKLHLLMAMIASVGGRRNMWCELSLQGLLVT